MPMDETAEKHKTDSPSHCSSANTKTCCRCHEVRSIGPTLLKTIYMILSDRPTATVVSCGTVAAGLVAQIEPNRTADVCKSNRSGKWQR